MADNRHLDLRTDGFTVVEVIVTLIVLSLFLFAFFQAYLALESQRIGVARQAAASDIAYSNLNKVTSRPSQLTEQLCNDNAAAMDLTSGNPSTKPGLDLTAAGNGGYILEPTADIQKILGGNAGQQLRAFAPSGCTDFDNKPVKIVSTVSFGTNGDKVVHASYVK